MTQVFQLPDNVLLPPVTKLQAGMLTCLYEEGRLRYLRAGRHLLLQMIYPAVRDEHWGTLPAYIDQLSIQQTPDTFLVTYTALYGGGAPLYRAYFRFEGWADSSLHISMHGEALQPFDSNRIGLCVLHPLGECCGVEATITTPDDEQYTAVFPESVHPEPVFTSIRRMQWRSGGNAVSIFFEGDLFETEDQRNWSDGSFKTYSTPSSRPIPVSVAVGDSIAQQIIVRVTNENAHEEEKPAISTEKKRPFPLIGFSRPAANHAALPTLLPLLQKIPLHHYRVSLALQQEDWQSVLSAAIAEAALLQAKLALVVCLPVEFETSFNQLLALLIPMADRLHSLLLLQDDQAVTSSMVMNTLYPIIKKQLPALLLAYGTEGSFADLNRQRPADVSFDVVTFSLHPQVHATDARSILDNLDSHTMMLETARELAAGKDVHVSPITFADEQAAPDDRQYGSLLAWWTIKSLQQLGGAAAVNYFELFGDKGLLGLPEKEKYSGHVRRSVLYDVLVAIRQFAPVFIVSEAAPENAGESVLLENEAGERLRILPPALAAVG